MDFSGFVVQDLSIFHGLVSFGHHLKMVNPGLYVIADSM